MIESLENRIAPAAVVHFFEADGDKITVSTSKGTKADLQAALGINEGATGIDQFSIDLVATAELSTAFAGTNVTVTASGKGDKLANYVQVNAYDGSLSNAIDLGVVKVKGHLVSIDAGDSDLKTPAIKSVSTTSWALGLDATAAWTSQIHGNINCITVAKAFNGEIVSVDESQTANFHRPEGTRIGKFTAGNFADGAGQGVGHLQVSIINALTIKGAFFGPLSGDANNGLIEARLIGKINIGTALAYARIVLS
jgi:hypothetical protein